ncbi:MAG TPA: S8 family serine peptidase [Myxococcaceae bacterium]|nr:S8 family serine peptidase [Myxococcaceae bacterium]
MSDLRIQAVLFAGALSIAACSRTDLGATKDASSDDPGARVPGAIVVDFKDGTTKAEFDAWEKEWGIDLEFNSIEGPEDGVTIAVGVQDVEGVLAKIRAHPAVEAAEPLKTYEKTDFVPNDPDFSKQWNLQQIRMPQAWESSRGKGAIVAVLDTGIAYEDYQMFRQVPDLKGVRFVKGYNFVAHDEHPVDDHGHGTHVAGTIAQATNNREGVAGIAFEAALMPLKVLDRSGMGVSADIADAIRFAADHGANVINMSLGGGGYSRVIEKAVAYARKKGVTVVSAAGNTGQGQVAYPAAYPGAVAVGAVGPSGRRAPYSSFGKQLDIAAPGGDKRAGPEGGILQNTIDRQNPARSVYESFQGTSMATAHVSGVAALLYAKGARTPDQVEKALFDGASVVDGKEWSEEYGHGLLNAEKSLQLVARPTPAPDWWPFAVSAGLLVVVMLTLRSRQRPGYLNLLFSPAFFIPLVLATVGVFFARWAFGGARGLAATVVDFASLPIPDWQRIVFGRGRLASPLFYSALIPLVGSAFAIAIRGARQMVAGLAMGFAGFLLYAAWSRAPGLAFLPFHFLALPWLIANALICLFIARALLKKEIRR